MISSPSRSAGQSIWYSPYIIGVAVVGVLVAAAAIRVAPLAGDHFPVNDGGLFYMMIEEIRNNHFRLPATTSYNGLGIPFAYPPLGLYIAALVGTVAGIPSMEVVRAMPVVVSVLTVLAVFPLARRLTGDSWMAILAIAAFAILPRSYMWMVMGGGITRSVGFLFAVLAITQLHDLYARGGRRPLMLAALFSAGAVLSHMEAGWLVVYSSVALWANGRRGVAGIRDTAILGAIGLLLTSPWWGTVLLRHGIQPFVAALHSGERATVGLSTLASFAFSGTPGFDIIALLGLAGLFTTLRQRHLLLPSWLFLIFVMDPRAGPSYAMVPLSALAAIGFFDLARGSGRLAGGDGQAEGQRHPAWFTSTLRALPPASAAVAAVLLWLAAGVASPVATRDPLHILPPEDRDAMAWARRSTPEDSRFMVLGISAGWWSDIQGEWFPALAERRSVATPQGREWLPVGDFETSIQRHADATWCGSFEAVCLFNWAEENATSFDFVYVPVASTLAYSVERRAAVPECCVALFDSLSDSKGFRLRFRNDRVAIFEWIGPPPGARLAF